MKQEEVSNQNIKTKIQTIDDELSNRFIALDPSGYFIIRLDHKSLEIVVEHFLNDIDEKGRAVDPSTGEPIGCNQIKTRTAATIYKGLSAKEIGIKLTEGEGKLPITRIDHAMYLGRELQRAEECLKKGIDYIQD